MMTLMKALVLTLLLALTQVTNASQTIILVMGDSLSAGYGINVEEGWVNLLQKQLTQRPGTKIINASVSGETSSGGLTRLPALLDKHHPTIVILELGANDGLRGQPLKLMQENLQAMIDASQNSNAKVLLVGMQIPTNYGPRYTKQFREIYPQLAEKNKIKLVPFLLDKVAAHSELVQNDGLHPTASAQPIILKNVVPVLMPMLDQ